MNSIWRWLKRSTCSARGNGSAGGLASVAASASSIGPAGEGSRLPAHFVVDAWAVAIPTD